MDQTVMKEVRDPSSGIAAKLTRSDYVDLRKARHQSMRVCQQHAISWECMKGGGHIVIHPNVKAAVESVEAATEETVAFVVGSPHLAGMVRHHLFP